MENRKNVTLLLIRHGQALSNVSRTLTSYPEKVPRPLSEQGRVEVQKTAESLKGTPIDVLIASPLTRTQETAKIISEVVGAEVQTDERLRETDFGIYDNTSYLQFFTRYPHPWLRRRMNKESRAEGLEDVRVRAKDFLRSVQEEYAGKTVAVVTHADVIREMISVIEGVDSWISVLTASAHTFTLRGDWEY